MTVRPLTLLAFFAIACSAAGSDDVRTLAIHEKRVALGAEPAVVTMRVDRGRLRASAGALALRIEGLTVSRHPDTVFEIYLGERHGEPAGSLSFYGGEGENGRAVRDVPVTIDAVEAALGRGSSLRVIIVPATGGQPGRSSFTTLRLIRQ